MRLDELRANVREDLLDARLALGEHAELVGELEALVAEHPLRERLWQQLIARPVPVAVARPRRCGASRPCVPLLRDELGLEPSPALRELEARVLTDDPTLLHVERGAAPPRRRRLPVETTQLVGRDDELGDTRRAAARAPAC